MNKCQNCPVTGDTPCIAFNNTRYCQLADKGEDHWKNIIREKSLDPDVQKKPGFLQKISNFVPALVNHALTGWHNAPEEVIQVRQGICDMCMHQSIDGNRECLICGCPVLEKTKWADQECPIGKWNKHVQEVPQTLTTEAPPTGGGCGCGK